MLAPLHLCAAVWCGKHGGKARVYGKRADFRKRSLVLLVALVAFFGSGPSFPASSGKEYDFDIKQLRADLAINAIAKQSRMPAIFPYERLKGVQGNALKGRFTVSKALNHVLHGTGLEAFVTEQGVITVLVPEPDSQIREENMRSKRKTSVSGNILAFVSALFVADESLAQEDDVIDELEVITVVGTRTQNPNLTSANTVSTLDQVAIQYAARTNVEAIVSDIPALVGSDGANEGIAVNVLNLRNLGANRTLTLVNGKRFVGTVTSGNGLRNQGFVDTRNIPVNLIERVEVLTGGASAVYGADAVTGVVNFVLRDNFEGLEVNGQYGAPEAGGTSDQLYSMALGKNFAGDRGNVVLTYTFSDTARLDVNERSFSTRTGRRSLVNNPALATDPNATPERVFIRGIRESFFAEGALLDGFRIFSNGFNGDGSSFQSGQAVGGQNGTSQIGGDGLFDQLLFPFDLIPDAQSNTATLNLKYDISDSATPYLEVSYTDLNTSINSQPSLTVGQTVALDNAFLPGGEFADAIAVVGAGTPLGPPIFFNRFDVDLPLDFTRDDVSTDTLRFVAGIKGEITDSLNYDLYVNHGRSNSTSKGFTRADDRYFAAVDAIDIGGSIVCRSDVDPSSFNMLGTGFVSIFDPSDGPVTFSPGANSGCTPFNPFVFDLQTNREAMEWIWQPYRDRSKVEQTVVSGHLAGNTEGLGVTLPGGAVEYVLGAEYREEQIDTNFDPLRTNERNVAFNRTSDLDGKFDVSETFGELVFPVLKEAGPLLHELNFEGAVRYSNYSTIGSTLTWRGGTVWAPMPGLKFRGTYAEAVRAPNISELFAPVSSGPGGLVDDPCDINNLNLGSPTRMANCAAILSPLGIDPTTYQQPSTALGLIGRFGGNPNLAEETARTATIGAIIQPAFVEKLIITIDYFSIELEGAVIQAGPTELFAACVDAPTLSNPFCPLTERSTTTGAPTSFFSTSVNVAAQETSGIDYSATYSFETNRYGVFDIVITGSYLEELDIQSSTLPIFDGEVGERATLEGGSAPRHVVNFDLNWAFGKWDGNYGFNYHSKLSFFENDTPNPERLIEKPFSDPLRSHEVQIGYSPHGKIRIYAGASNIADQEPPLGSTRGIAGPRGRTYYLGMNFSTN